jgi:predicted dehydrogenase
LLDPDVSHSARPLGLGLVGCGRFGEFCLTAFATIPDLELVGVADLDRGRAQAVAAGYGMTAYPDYAALLSDELVDVVAINTPPVHHAAMALAAAAAGKHIFCEKPLATTIADATSVLMAVRDAGVRLSVDYVMRWNPLYGLLHHLQALSAGERPLLGPLRHFGLENHAGDEDIASDHWFWDERISGGIFVEHGVHFFDICDWLMGTHSLAIQALQVRRPGGGQIDTVVATCTHPDGATASFLHAFTHPNLAQYQGITLDWGFAHGLLTGWIPVGLDLEVWTNDQGLAVLEGLSSGAGEPLQVAGYRLSGGEGVEVSRVEAYGNPRPWRARGETRDVSRRLRLRASLGGEAAKDYVYRECIRAGMADLVSSVSQDRTPRVTAADAWHSLATAVAAQAGAGSAQPMVPATFPADLASADLSG